MLGKPRLTEEAHHSPSPLLKPHMHGACIYVRREGTRVIKDRPDPPQLYHTCVALALYVNDGGVFYHTGLEVCGTRQCSNS